MPKKILFYTDTPLLGGAENQMFTLAKFLPKDKYEVTLACSDFKNLNGWCQEFIEEEMNVIRLRVLHKHDPRHYLFLKKILPNFDLLHLHIWNPASCRFAFLAANKTPIIVTEHDPFPIRGIKGAVKNFLFKKIKKIIVASEAAKQLVLEQDPSLQNKITVIHNGINIEEWERESKFDGEKEDFRTVEMKSSNSDKIVLCVAELNERKGQKYLIEAMKKVTEEFPRAKLVFVGEGYARKYYEKISHSLGDRVAFLGRRREIAKIMVASDIFVLPSVREAFGLVILEAAVSGLPSIASRIGGIPEIIEDGKTGVLVPPGSAESLQTAIKLLLGNEALRSSLKEEAKKRAYEHFDAREMALNTAKEYDDILNKDI